ncbi:MULTISPECIES: peptide IlvX [Salmonella]|nr:MULTISPECIES: peptide IlvX [Salmonella]
MKNLSEEQSVNNSIKFCFSRFTTGM